MKISVASFSFIFACLLLFIVQPASAKMDAPVTQEQVKTGEKLSLKARLIQKRISKKISKHLKKVEDKLGVSNDELIRWILIGLAIIVALALLKFVGINLGGLLSLVILVLLVILAFRYLL